MQAPIQAPCSRKAALAAVVTATVALLGAASAHACGVCVEDKMAATYDHDVVQRALAQHRLVVFCEVEGALPDIAAVQRAALRAAGVEPRSVRVSAQPAALSFALDPSVQSPGDAVREVARALGAGVQLTLLRTLPAPPP